MATIKKKDIKKYKKVKDQDLEELVDADGSPIEGDRNPTNDSEIETAPQQTSDDFAKAAIQPNRYYHNVHGSDYSHGTRAMGESELAEAKMRDMIERMLNAKSKDNDMVKRFKETDMNQNNVPDMKDLEMNKPITAKKTQDLIKSMQMNNLTPEEVDVVIAAIQDYRQSL